MHSIKHYLCRGAILSLFVFVTASTAPALSTGIPVQFSIDPASIRQMEKDKSSVVATVVLKAPSPTFFVCQIRSSDGNKISFSNIVFKKGQIQGTAEGTVYWLHILKDSTIKISAFSVDEPEEKLWFTVALKVKDEDEDEEDKNKEAPVNEQEH